MLGAELSPGAVHRFLATLPQRLERLGYAPRYQLILNTNYDRALEQAFDDAGEPYDLAVYTARGDDRDLFVHFPHGDVSPVQVSTPNAYAGFPIDEYGELERTVIVKIHGEVDRTSGGPRRREKCVITEDDYIDYLRGKPIEGLVPTQILDKLRDSHCLFLGYAMRDWPLRVFPNRIWAGKPLGAKSWAVEPHVDALEKELWTHRNVDVFLAGPAEYVDLLGRHLDERVAAGSAP
jgi:hypothetical protein